MQQLYRATCDWLHDVVFLHDPGRSARHSWLHILPVLAIGSVYLHQTVVSVPAPLAPDTHAQLSLETAINREFCGVDSFSTRSLAAALLRDQRANDIPIRDLIRREYGTVYRYCQSPSWTFVNSENSLMLLELWCLRLAPRLSFARLAAWLLIMKSAVLLLFAAVLITAGGSDLLASALIVLGAWTMRQMSDRATGIHSFMFVQILLMIAIYVLALRFAPRRHGVWGATIALLTGVFSAFATNMRTSYLPLYVAFFLMFLIYYLRHSASARIIIIRGIALSAVFAIGYIAFQYVCITRHLPERVTYNSSYHPIAHSLVLSLALPPNPLSNREGIMWEDAVGLRLARRVNPAATYLGPEYEPALFRFYFELWRREPFDMLRLYRDKFKMAGKDMIDRMAGPNAATPRAIATVLWPLTWAPNGLWLLAACIVTGVATARRAWVTGSLLATVVVFMSVAGTMLLVESGMIVSHFAMMYHNYLFYYAVFMMLTAYGLLLTIGWRIVVATRVRVIAHFREQASGV